MAWHPSYQQTLVSHWASITGIAQHLEFRQTTKLKWKVYAEILMAIKVMITFYLMATMISFYLKTTPPLGITGKVPVSSGKSILTALPIFPFVRHVSTQRENFCQEKNIVASWLSPMGPWVPAMTRFRLWSISKTVKKTCVTLNPRRNVKRCSVR